MSAKFSALPGSGAHGLGKHLTGDKLTGYDELFIRVNVKLPDGFNVNGSGDANWKWQRLFQNTEPDMSNSNETLTENRPNSLYAMQNFAVNKGMFDMTFPPNHCRKQEAGSVGSARYGANFFPGTSPPRSEYKGYFEHVGSPAEPTRGAWELTPGQFEGDLVNTGQTYHTVEWHIKLSDTAGVPNGRFELWFDGVPQLDDDNPPRNGWTWQNNDEGFAEPSNIITSRAGGSGYNFFRLFSTLREWVTGNWDQPGVDNFWYVRDLVISTTRIGHDYVVTGTNDNKGVGATAGPNPFAVVTHPYSQTEAAGASPDYAKFSCSWYSNGVTTAEFEVVLASDGNQDNWQPALTTLSDASISKDQASYLVIQLNSIVANDACKIRCKMVDTLHGTWYSNEATLTVT